MAACGLNSTYIPLFLPSQGTCSSGDSHSLLHCLSLFTSSYKHVGKPFLHSPPLLPPPSFAIVNFLQRTTCISFSTHPSLTPQPTAICLLFPMTTSTLHSPFSFLNLFLLVFSSSVNRYHMRHWLHSDIRQ